MATYKLGHRDRKVLEIKQALQRQLGAGYRLVDNTKPSNNNKFDELTDEAVRQFQWKKRLDVDGKVGPKTMRALATPRKFLHLYRRHLDTFKARDYNGVTLGEIYVKIGGERYHYWKPLCLTYEQPLILTSNGKTRKGRSIKDPKGVLKGSCIRKGNYPLKIRKDGEREWRLELITGGTSESHRKNVQIHRSGHTLPSLGCILPIDSITYNALKEKDTDSDNQGLTDSERKIIARGNARLKSISMGYMSQIKMYYDMMDFKELQPALLTISDHHPSVVADQQSYDTPLNYSI